MDACGSRQRGRRSAVALTDDVVVVGTAAGDLRAFERTAGNGDDAVGPERWRRSGEEPVVALTQFDGGVLAGTRGERGTIALVDADGTERWRVDGAADVGPPAKETRFWLPFVAALATDGSRAYAALRRYERRGMGDDSTADDADGVDDEDKSNGTARRFESVVYALDPDGIVRWKYAARASPIALATDGDRLAVAYNRCPEPDAHRDGLVVLDAEHGDERLRWDPRHAADAAAPAEADRAVGDVALTPDGYAVASHADRRGYLLDGDGSVTARLDLGATVEREPTGETDDGEPERVYAYPNHVIANDGVVAFVLGNTFPEAGRETAARHPAEHTAVGVSPDGTEWWRASVGGFAHHVASADGTLVVPTAQHFRDRDPAVHGVRLLDLADGSTTTLRTDGVATAVAIAEAEVAAVEEPVTYHDGVADGHGAYRLHGWGR
ncbi:transcriptional regulator (plasmid) [Halobaculum magnesiiphilum]|uniref:Transcriptional regulator n=1 Tax=Halobaculum magnesiiphilum TaxID=1017351 RepID=A0A8T8WJP2_9EURY|nr:transcriptional regulator [Halobaculum magnesiiphilum]